jgi:hypothetical protein
MDLELFFGLAVENDLKAKNEQKVLNQKKRWCAKATMFRLKGDRANEWRSLRFLYSDPRAKAYLTTTYGDKVEEILNETLGK